MIGQSTVGTESLLREQTGGDVLGVQGKEKKLQRVSIYKRDNVIGFILLEDITNHVKRKLSCLLDRTTNTWIVIFKQENTKGIIGRNRRF